MIEVKTDDLEIELQKSQNTLEMFTRNMVTRYNDEIRQITKDKNMEYAGDLITEIYHNFDSLVNCILYDFEKNPELLTIFAGDEPLRTAIGFLFEYTCNVAFEKIEFPNGSSHTKDYEFVRWPKRDRVLLDMRMELRRIKRGDGPLTTEDFSLYLEDFESKGNYSALYRLTVPLATKPYLLRRIAAVQEHTRYLYSWAMHRLKRFYKNEGAMFIPLHNDPDKWIADTITVVAPLIRDEIMRDLDFYYLKQHKHNEYRKHYCQIEKTVIPAVKIFEGLQRVS